MHYRRLGRTDIEVSAICLGTMTWGEQNTEAEAHDQLDRALDAGVNFIDTAEMYPVPPRAETQGRTERYIGSWLAKGGKRERVVLATKVSGRSKDMTWLRGGPRLTREHIEQALDDSLQRLGTDYVDLYQLHWPDRPTNVFGRMNYRPPSEDDAVPIEDQLRVLDDLVRAGKVRCVGLSNETPWGTMRFVEAAERLGLPRVVSVQNPYSLLNRTFEIGHAEVAHREDAGLLAYSPLGFGTLSGKYLGGAQPEGARLTLWGRFGRYGSDQARRATERYVALARESGLDPAQMALAFVTRQPFVTSNIIGATTLDQLESNLASAELELGEDVLEGIEAIHKDQPNPAP